MTFLSKCPASYFGWCLVALKHELMIVMMRHELQNHCFWATFFFLLIVARVETCHRQIWVSSNHRKYQYYTLANIVNDRHNDCFSVVKKSASENDFLANEWNQNFSCFPVNCFLLRWVHSTEEKMMPNSTLRNELHSSELKKLICGAVVQKIRACHGTEWNSSLLRARGHS